MACGSITSDLLGVKPRASQPSSMALPICRPRPAPGCQCRRDAFFAFRRFNHSRHTCSSRGGARSRIQVCLDRWGGTCPGPPQRRHMLAGGLTWRRRAPLARAYRPTARTGRREIALAGFERGVQQRLTLLTGRLNRRLAPAHAGTSPCHPSHKSNGRPTSAHSPG